MIEKMTSLGVHEQPVPESEQVAIALSPRTMGPLLDQLFRFEAEKAEAGSQPSECRILDAKYEPGSYCRILYELGDQLVTGTYKWDSDQSQTPGRTTVIPSLGMQVYRFPNDPALPSLTRAIDPQVI